VAAAYKNTSSGATADRLSFYRGWSLNVIRVARLRSLLTGRPLTGNGVVLLTALYGLVGWAQTTYTVHLLYPLELGRTPPSGASVGFREVGPWIQVLTQYTWELMWLWGGLTVALFVVVALFGERGAVLNGPNLAWGVGTVLAMGLTAYGIDARIQYLIWLPWLVLYAACYLVTGLVVERGGVYLGAAGVSGLLTLYGVYALLTGSGALVLTTETTVPAQAPLAGAVLLPFPYVYAVLGVLHVGPMLVDGLRGGRQLTAEGVPAVKTQQDDADGGVIEA
jgi:hypothetical protein